MNRLRLLLTLRRHARLAERRSPLYEQNRWAKLLYGAMGCFALFYLAIVSIPLALVANSSGSFTSCGFFYGIVPFILTADFLLRFIGQQTPVQLVKPYLLLPIPRFACVESFIFASLITPNNLFWMALTVPYVVMTNVLSIRLGVAIGLVLSVQLMILINSQWYMLCRSLINKNLVWWLLPAVVYGLLFVFLAISGLDAFMYYFATWEMGFAHWIFVPWLLAFSMLLALVEINKRVQFRLTYTESGNTESKPVTTIGQLQLLGKYGVMGEYLKLEVRSIMRNKNIRKTFIFATMLVMLLSMVISFTDIYRDGFTQVFWAVYTFILYGAMMLIRVMCAEGNYIDCLMVHKENIEQLLRAKYYFYCSLLLIPLILMLPTVLTGKYSLLTMLSMASFTAGPIYCLLMQMAVFNRRTIPLNVKFISRSGVGNDYLQLLVELVVMFLPVAIISILRLLFSENTTYVILLVIGTVFIATHRLWIRCVYQQFMQRRYLNIEGFHSTR